MRDKQDKMISMRKHRNHLSSGAQMCGGCQALAKKSHAEHNSNTPLKTCVTYVSKPGKALLMERIFRRLIDRTSDRHPFIFLESLNIKWVTQPLPVRPSYDQEKMLTKQRSLRLLISAVAIKSYRQLKQSVPVIKNIRTISNFVFPVNKGMNTVTSSHSWDCIFHTCGPRGPFHILLTLKFQLQHKDQSEAK